MITIDEIKVAISKCVVDGVEVGYNKYELAAGFCVDIIADTDDSGELMWNVWLYHKDFGVKVYMFGVYDKYFDNRNDVGACVINNLLVDPYIEGYIEDHAPELMGW